MRYVKVTLMNVPWMITQSQSMRDAAMVLKQKDTDNTPWYKTLIFGAGKDNDSSMNMGQLAWPRCSHEGYQVLPKTSATHTSALHYRHSLTMLGVSSHSKKCKSPN